MTVYYVDVAVGNDINDGLSEGAGNAWATIDHAMDNVASAAGDHVYVKASGIYPETVTIDTVGAVNNPTIFEGYATVPGDNGIVEIDGESTRLYGLTSSLGATYYVFLNFDIKNHTTTGIQMPLCDSVALFNCKIRNNAGRGIFGDNWWTITNCEVLGNSTQSIDVDQGLRVLGCIVGVANQYMSGSGGTGVLYKTVCYGAQAGSSAISWNAGLAICAGCIIDGETITQDCIQGDDQTVYVDNVVHDPSGSRWPLYRATLTDTGRGVTANCITNGGLAFMNTPVPVIDYWQNQRTVPNFKDEAADDYRPTDSSPMVNAGMMPGCIT
jgi:hypothetical protein